MNKTTIDRLRSCTSIADLISEFQLKISPSQFSYIVYCLRDEDKYANFEIPKKSGGVRIIHSPKDSLKYIQREVATILLNCIDDIKLSNPNYLRCNHAFEKDKSIVSNANIHEHKRFVLNIDIKNFFSSIHYGRIKGLLISDANFLLNEKIGQIIAKLATYNRYLPQGAPTSPILASLIGNILDIRLLKLAKEYRFSYSRYADDITLSSNQELPNELIYWDKEENIWIAGNKITKIIKKSGFELNPLKTRYVRNTNRQLVTGIVVNKKRNVVSLYRKINRAMTYSLLSTGQYTIRDVSGLLSNGTINQLIGRISHCIYVKYHNPPMISTKNSQRADLRKMNSERVTKIISDNWNRDGKSNISYYCDHQTMLLRSVLFFKYFISNERTTIIPEGFTDPIYFKTALSSLELNVNLHFQKLNRELKKIGIYGGASFVNSFLCNIETKKRGFISYGMIKQIPQKPVIFILDYDGGLEDCKYLLSKIKDGEQYINITNNIYILLLRVKHNKDHKNINNHIYTERLISYQGNKIQAKDDNHEYILFKNTEYKKYNFAKYISKHKDEFKFDSFKDIFNKIKEIEDDYQTKLATNNIKL